MEFLVLFLLVLLAYPISVYALIKWYHSRRMSNGERSIWIPIACMPILACIWSYLTVVLYIGAFGPGLWMLLCSLPVTVISLLQFFTGQNAQKAKNDIPKLQWWIRLLVFTLTLSMSLAPILGLTVISSACYKLHSWLAEPIIGALHAYEADSGAYPRDLETLVPDYLETIPKPFCLYLNPVFVLLWNSNDNRHDMRQYHIEHCTNTERETNNRTGERIILTVENIAGGFPYRYNLQTGEWSSVSYFDGVCSYLD
jgi:hypothetical protein